MVFSPVSLWKTKHWISLGFQLVYTGRKAKCFEIRLIEFMSLSIVLYDQRLRILLLECYVPRLAFTVSLLYWPRFLIFCIEIWSVMYLNSKGSLLDINSLTPSGAAQLFVLYLIWFYCQMYKNWSDSVNMDWLSISVRMNGSTWCYIIPILVLIWKSDRWRNEIDISEFGFVKLEIMRVKLTDCSTLLRVMPY